MDIMDDPLDNWRSNEQNEHIIFGKYELGRLLGQGTFAKVYYARDLATLKSVAVKVIKIQQVKKQGLMEQITHEIAAMRLVRHPNVVQLKEVMATKTKIFIIMEYVKGGELFAKVVKGRLKEDSARKYFQQLISAVDYCHSRGVSHRDLKPENLLLDENEDLKVSDFGLSALPDQLRNDGKLHTQCGTPAYVAPEVLRKKGYDGAKADIWSCGVILYVLLAGYLPFREENVMHMYGKIFKAEYEFPRWISTDARRLITKLLVVNQSRRLTIPLIMRTPWFLKGLKTCDSNGVNDGLAGYTSQILLKTPSLNEEKQKDDKVCSEEENAIRRSKSSPSSYNAFAFISSMCLSFNLSGMFQTNLKLGSVFTSKFSASTIVNKLQTVAKKVDFKISYSKKNDYKLKMQGVSEGRKGKVSVEAEVFEVAPEVAVVEFSKVSGDSLEYEKFEEDIRPGLQDIVWSWQGENSNG